MAPFLAQRSERAFERIYQQHVGDVYRYTLAVLRNAPDAEDVTQTTFLNAYRAFQAGERPRQPQNWLIAIAHNVCRQRFRQSQRRVQEVAYDDTVAESFVADEEAPSADDIRRAMSHLAFNQRAALVMRELEGRTYSEIAEILGLSDSAVETLIFRARRALREQLEGGLTCREAEVAVSRQLDGRLSRAERGPLRAHLRECDECAATARTLRAQRSAIRALGLVPVPPSLATFFGGASVGGAALAGLGGGVAAKAVAGVAASAVLAVGGLELAQNRPWQAPRAETAPAAAAAQSGGEAASTRPAAARAPEPLALASRERRSRHPSRSTAAAEAAVPRPPGHERAAAAHAENQAKGRKPAKAKKADRRGGRTQKADASQPRQQRARTGGAKRQVARAKPSRGTGARPRAGARVSYGEPAQQAPKPPKAQTPRNPEPARAARPPAADPLRSSTATVAELVDTAAESVKKAKHTAP